MSARNVPLPATFRFGQASRHSQARKTGHGRNGSRLPIGRRRRKHTATDGSIAVASNPFEFWSTLDGPFAKLLEDDVYPEPCDAIEKPQVQCVSFVDRNFGRIGH
jgi:hypothetical protein